MFIHEAGVQFYNEKPQLIAQLASSKPFGFQLFERVCGSCRRRRCCRQPDVAAPPRHAAACDALTRRAAWPLQGR
jgi:hypothetical protein